MTMRNKVYLYKTYITGIALTLAVLGFSQSSIQGAESDGLLLAQGLDAGQLTDILSAANVARSSTGIKAINAGSAVTILAQTKPGATDRGLKVDGVFIAKTLFGLADAGVQRVKVIFSESGKPGRYVAIGKAEIDAYGAGKITADQLLLRVRLVSVNDEPVTPNLASGPQYERRLLVWQRIDALKKRGTGVKPFETLFSEVETAITAGDTSKVSEKLAYLEEKVQAQEEQVKLAKQAASGRGMRGYQSAAAGGGHGQGVPLPSMSGSAGAEPAIPGNSEWIRQQFNEQAGGVLQKASGSSASTLRQLKTAIDQAFSSNKKGSAFQMIHQFQVEAMRATGIDIMMPQMPGGGPPGGGGGPMGGGGPPGGGPPGGGPPGF